ncbi:LacI family DNA-binding transcriptional regulator [Demequina zhanjiangensis]|uniref:LacI family DNA-binding transcriptional regulator n=1 Tax=Demequina zhanjiangensis TaxID=3051659 RepID=A0ABT8FYB6_9MICO|nr:LacI family DNA-binding transcriptional regulator [Demequina sp. SYSU T00b26]MDN4471875.1 LacI family DNA-binding transcriptional regulator [Demequina sp. SYSU T00b26]
MEAEGRVKLADVAALAGVSIATVSKVVNGRYGVGSHTIARVQRAVDELGYVPNLSASGLRSKSTGVLGFLVADFEPYAAELLKGAARAAHGSDYELLAHAGGWSQGWERKSLGRLGGTLVDGAVMATPTVQHAATSVPVVAVDPHYGPNQGPTIDSDSFAGAREGTAHLIGLGHRRIGFIGGRKDLGTSRLREAGFRAAMEDAGLPVDDSLVVYARYEPKLAGEAARALLAQPEPPTALFVSNDVMALRVIEVAEENGVLVPERLSVIGFDDVPEASMLPRGLTTVRQPLQAMGFAAMEMLLRILAGRDGADHVRMPTELVVRGTTAQAP